MRLDGWGKQRRSRSHAASFANVAPAVFVAIIFVCSGAVLYVGPAETRHRLDCGLNNLVNQLLPAPRPCR